MSEIRKIYVPAGKKLKDVRGLYTYVGPRDVIHHSKLQLEPTFTDGTPWEYTDSTKSEPEAAPKRNTVEELKIETEEAAPKPKYTKKQKVEAKDVPNVSVSDEPESVAPQRVEGYKTQRNSSKRDED